MHKNLHKKDEICIKTYFLHKKTPQRVPCGGEKCKKLYQTKNPYPYGDRD